MSSRENEDMNIPGLEDIEYLADPKSYKEGKRIFEDGDILEMEIDENEITATVCDINMEINYPEITLTFDHQVYTKCTCEHIYQKDTMCHCIVAVLFQLNHNPSSFDIYGNVTEDTTSNLLENITPEQALEFLAKIMSNDSNMLHKFITKNKLKSAYNVSKYSGDMNTLYKNAEREDDGKITEMIDFKPQFDEARRKRREGDNSESAGMYKIIAETISKRVNEVKDDTGYYADCFIEALEGMIETILRERLDHEKKRDYISYLFEKATNNNGTASAKFSRHYYDGLKTICNTQSDFKFWLELAVIPDDRDISNEELVEILRMQSYVLEQMKQHAKIVDLLAERFPLNSGICVLYLKALYTLSATASSSSSASSASLLSVTTAGNIKDIAIKATETFPDDANVLEAAYKLFGDNDDKYRGRILEKLYAITGEWDYIIRLKRVLPKWKDNIQQTISRLTDISPKNAVEMCIKEEMPEEAMDVLEQASDVELVLSYRAKLMRKSSKRYTACYMDKLFKFVGEKSNREHYKRVSKYLGKLKEMPKGKERYEELLNKIKEEYSTRRALLDELEK